MLQSLGDRMGAFEQGAEAVIPPETHVAILLDTDFGEERLFTPSKDRIYDLQRAKAQLKAAAHLLRSREDASFTFVDPLGLAILLDMDSYRQRRPLRQVIAQFASETAAKIALDLGRVLKVDCRVFTLPGVEQTLDFFHWRQLRLTERTMDRYCEAVMLEGDTLPGNIKQLLTGFSEEEKEALLADHGVSIAAIPSWQRVGAAMYRDEQGAELIVDTDLPAGEAFRAFVGRFVVED